MPVSTRRIAKEILMLYDVHNLSLLLLDGLGWVHPTYQVPLSILEATQDQRARWCFRTCFLDCSLIPGEWTAVTISDSSRSHIPNHLALLCLHFAQGFLPSEMYPSLPSSAFWSSPHSSQLTSGAIPSKMCLLVTLGFTWVVFLFYDPPSLFLWRWSWSPGQIQYGWKGLVTITLVVSQSCAFGPAKDGLKWSLLSRWLYPTQQSLRV